MLEVLDRAIGNDDLLLLQHFALESQAFTADYGILLGDDGDRAVAIFPGGTANCPTQSCRWVELDDGSCESLEAVRYLAKVACSEVNQEKPELFRVLGFSAVAEESTCGHSVYLATAPTASFLNTSLRKIYDDRAKGEPPFLFAGHEGLNGKFSVSEFIIQLARGRILISSARDADSLSHDLSLHVVGYIMIDPGTFSYIRKRAQQLVDLNKLGTNEAVLFYEAVEDLSTHLRRRYRTNTNSFSKFYDPREPIRYILEGGRRSRNRRIDMSDSAVARLEDHEEWLYSRAIVI